MAKRIPLAELRDLIERAIHRESEIINEIGGYSDNPQVRQTRIMAESRQEAFSAIEAALNGNATLLKIYANK